MVIGIIGKIASGKSYLENILREEGYTVIDCDRLAKIIIAERYNTIIKILGEACLNSDGILDYKKIAKIIFSDAVKRKQVEDLVKPLLREHFTQFEHETNVIFVSAFDLNGIYDIIAFVIEVRAPLYKRIYRICRRKNALNMFKRMWIQRKLKYHPGTLVIKDYYDKDVVLDVIKELIK